MPTEEFPKKRMKKLLILSIFFLTTSVLLHAGNSKMPQVSGKDLNQKPWIAPAGLPAKRTFVFVSFGENQQEKIDSWLDGLELKTANRELPWIQMTVINDPGKLFQWFINRQMKEGITSSGDRVWMAYTDQKAFLHSCGMMSPDTVYALVVDQNGQIVAMESGRYKMAVAEKLFRAIQSR